MPLPAIEPTPPVASGIGLPWDVEVADPCAALARARAEYGDTFVVDSGEDRYLFTFSAVGVESFYALPEDEASKGLADWRMLRRKLPDEIFVGRRTLPAQLFRRDDVAGYLSNLSYALDAAVTELGPSGIVDAFAMSRRLAHRMGLASWAGPGCAIGAVFDLLVEAFDALDGADAFVHPDAMAAVAASGKRAERAALREITEVVGTSLQLHERAPEAGLFARIVSAWDGEPADARATGIAYDIALIHVASMSNLAAALGWAIVDLLAHNHERRAIAGGDGELAQRCALESIRCAQRSIMSRYVVTPITFNDGAATYAISPGATIATLLPLTNTSSAPGLNEWQPGRWNRHRLADTSALASPQLVTAFGHGRHSCPAQSFSLAAMTTTVTRLFETFSMESAWAAEPAPVPGQIGGVARAADACPVVYARRSS